MKLYRVLVDCKGGVSGFDARFDVIIMAPDRAVAFLLAKEYLAGTGVRQRAVRGSLVEVVPDNARVIACESVGW